MIHIDKALQLTNENIRIALVGANIGIQQATSHLTKSTGKGIRALLLITAAADTHGYVHNDAIKAAAALEILHLASLVHDDVMDNADTRRGVSTLHKKFDAKTAVICGDYLLSLSLSMALDMDQERLKYYNQDNISLLPHFSRALSNLCKGEYDQHINLGNLNIDLFTYLKIISGKTASLFYVACYAGAILGQESDETARLLGKFGRCLGMIFQIADDCKDYEWTEKTAKKPVASDIKNKVITLPLILAMRKNKDLRNLAHTAMQMQNNTQVFVESLKNADGTKDAWLIAKRYELWAKKCIEGIAQSKKETLYQILQTCMESFTNNQTL